MESTHLVAGTFGAVYGIKGWLKINSFTDDPQAIFGYSPWLIKQGTTWREVSIADWKRHNQGFVCKIAQVDLREDAQAFTNLEIYVLKDTLPPLPEGEFYWRELIGCEVTTLQGYSMGKVVDLMETGSNDVLVVEANPKDAFGKTERLIPLIDGAVLHSVNREQRHIQVDWDPNF